MGIAKCIEIYAGTITFEVTEFCAYKGDTLTIEYDNDSYAIEIRENGDFQNEALTVSFPFVSRERSHGEKLLRREAGDKAYGDYQ